MIVYTFVILLLAGIAVRFWLASRQIRHVAAHRKAVPVEFSSRISLPSHQRAADYTIARAKLGMYERLFDSAVLVSLTLLGGLQAIDRFMGDWITHGLSRQLALIVSVALLLGGLGLPFTLYRQFVLEARFGFNRMTAMLFVQDAVKGIVVGAIIGLPLIAVMLWLMSSVGEYWWVWAWAVWTVFNILLLVLYPTLIAPLFNSFKPLDNPALDQRIRKLAERCNFALGGLFVMDGSRRSAHGNAYFTGFGRARRIVFFDTLLARLNADEIEAVLAHELGHFVRRHIVQRIGMSFVLAFGFFALLSWASNQPSFYESFGVTPRVDGANDAMALILFFLVLPVLTYLFTPVGSWYARRHEFEADDYASAQSQPESLISALVKLYDDNAATLTPDPIHSTFYDSHPPAAIRIRHLRGSTG